MRQWCTTRGRAVGALLTLDQGWALARAWFSDPRRPGWRRPPIALLADLVREHGLSGPFWDLQETNIGQAGPADREWGAVTTHDGASGKPTANGAQ